MAGYLTASQIAGVVSRYTSGESATSIAVSLSRTPQGIYWVLRRQGVQIRSSSESLRVHALRHDALDELTPASMYWCGFLFADGCVSHDKTGQDALVVGLARRDRDHIVKLRDFLGSTHKISDIMSKCSNGKSYPSSRLSVRSNHLTARLCELGRYDGSLDPYLAESCDFWRGVLDGDGWLGYSNGRPALMLVGSWWLLSAFRIYLLSRGVRTRANVIPHRSIYAFNMSGPEAVSLLRYLYADASVFLSRKELKARLMMGS